MEGIYRKICRLSHKVSRRLKERFRIASQACRWTAFQHSFRFLLPVGLAWVALFLTPGRETPDPFVDFQDGRVADHDVEAPFDFSVFKSESEIQHEREKAEAEVLPIFDYLPRVKDQVLGEILEHFNRLNRVVQDPVLAARIPHWEEYRRRRTSNGSSYTVNPSVLRALYRADSLLSLSDEEIIYLLDPDRSRLLRNSLKEFVVYRMRDGLINRASLDGIDGDFLMLRREGNESIEQKSGLTTIREAMDMAGALNVDPVNPEISKNLFIGILARFLQPNIIYNRMETESLRSLAGQRVKLTRDQTVLKGEKIIGRGERVTALQMERLESLKSQLKLRQGAIGETWQMRRDVGIYLVYLLLLLLLWIWLFLHHREIYNRFSNLLIITLNIIIVLGFAYLVLKSPEFVHLSYPGGHRSDADSLPDRRPGGHGLDVQSGPDSGHAGRIFHICHIIRPGWWNGRSGERTPDQEPQSPVSFDSLYNRGFHNRPFRR